MTLSFTTPRRFYPGALSILLEKLNQLELGTSRRGSSEELAREQGVSEDSLYGWKSKYGGMEVGEAQRLRSLEDENRRLLKAIVRKNGWSLPA